MRRALQASEARPATPAVAFEVGLGRKFLAICFAAVADADDKNADHFVFDAGDDAVVADAILPEIAQFCALRASPMLRGFSRLASRSSMKRTILRETCGSSARKSRLAWLS
jgi:hypothetical protein